MVLQSSAALVCEFARKHAIISVNQYIRNASMHKLEPKYGVGYTEFSSLLNQLRKWGFTDTKISELTRIERSMISKLRTQRHSKAGYDEGTAIMKLYYAVAKGEEPKLKSLQQMQKEHHAMLAKE